jgi:hypothetical protein
VFRGRGTVRTCFIAPPEDAACLRCLLRAATTFATPPDDPVTHGAADEVGCPHRDLSVWADAMSVTTGCMHHHLRSANDAANRLPHLFLRAFGNFWTWPSGHCSSACSSPEDGWGPTGVTSVFQAATNHHGVVAGGRPVQPTHSPLRRKRSRGQMGLCTLPHYSTPGPIADLARSTEYI